MGDGFLPTMKPLNVLMLAEVTAEAALGGAERVLREQVLGLQKRGHRVAIVTRASDASQRRSVSVGQAEEHRYVASRANEASFVWSSIRESIRLVDELSQQGAFDLGVIHQSLAGLGALLRRRHIVRQWLYVCLSLAHEEYVVQTPCPSSFLGRLRWSMNVKVRRWVEWFVIRRCSRVLVLSEFMRQRVLHVHGVPADHVHLAPGAVDLARFCVVSDRAGVRESIALPQQKLILFTVRRLVPRMGLENLILAAKELGDEGKDCLFVIGGEGPLRPQLEQMIREQGLSDRVSLRGFIPERDLPAFYQAADFFILPTYVLEGFGLVMVEALACGTPVIGTPIGAIPEVLNQLDRDLIAPGVDAASLAQAIRRARRRFHARPAEWRRISAAGRALVESRYAWDSHVGQFETILREAKEAA